MFHHISPHAIRINSSHSLHKTPLESRVSEPTGSSEFASTDVSMKQFLKWTGFILFAVIIGLALSVAYVAGVRALSPVAVVQQATTQATPLAGYSGAWGYGDWGGYGQTEEHSLN